MVRGVCSRCGNKRELKNYVKGDELPKNDCEWCYKAEYNKWMKAGNRMRPIMNTKSVKYINAPKPLMGDFETKEEYKRAYHQWVYRNPQKVSEGTIPKSISRTMRARHEAKFGDSKPFFGDYENRKEYSRDYQRWRKSQQVKFTKRKLNIIRKYTDPSLLPPPLEEFLEEEEVIIPPPPMFAEKLKID